MNDWLIYGIICVIIALIIIYIHYRNIITFWWAKYKARKKHLETGKRYYVVPGKDKLHIVGSHQIARLNRKLPEKKRINIVKLLYNSYFHTK